MEAPKIPPHLEPEIYERSQSGQTDPQISAWLISEKGVQATRLDVLRARQRYVRRAVKGSQARVVPEDKIPPGAKIVESSPALTGTVLIDDDVEIPLGDETMLREVQRDLARRYKLAKEDEIRLAYASVLSRVASCLRLMVRDRALANEAGLGDKPPTKGYAMVSPDDWPGHGDGQGSPTPAG